MVLATDAEREIIEERVTHGAIHSIASSVGHHVIIFNPLWETPSVHLIYYNLPVQSIGDYI